MATHSLLLPEINDAIPDFRFPISSNSSDSSSLKRKRPPRIEIPSVLQEIQPHKLVDSKENNNKDVSFGGIGYGVFSVKGKKMCMEDTHKIVSPLERNPKKVSVFLFVIIEFGFFLSFVVLVSLYMLLM